MHVRATTPITHIRAMKAALLSPKKDPFSDGSDVPIAVKEKKHICKNVSNNVHYVSPPRYLFVP